MNSNFSPEDKNEPNPNIPKSPQPGFDSSTEEDWLDQVETIHEDDFDEPVEDSEPQAPPPSPDVLKQAAIPPFHWEKRNTSLPGKKEENRVASLMVDVCLALLPLVIWGIYLFGWRVLTLTCISVISCVLFDVLSALALRRSPECTDLTAVVTGLLIALNLPPTAPLWLPVLAALIAIVFVKQLFGSLSKNRLNPAAAAIAALYLICPGTMTSLCDIGTKLPVLRMTAGTYEKLEATTLQTLLSGQLPKQSIGSLFVGMRSGMIGEMSALLILAGAIYLICRRIRKPQLPAAMLLTVAILAYIFPRVAIASDIIALRYASYQLLSGNLLLCAIYLAADPETSPKTSRASLVAGVLGGIIVFLIRYYVAPGIAPICAVLILNLLSRPLDILLKPSVFGGKLRKKATGAEKE